MAEKLYLFFYSELMLELFARLTAQNSHMCTNRRARLFHHSFLRILYSEIIAEHQQAAGVQFFYINSGYQSYNFKTMKKLFPITVETNYQQPVEITVQNNKSDLEKLKFLFILKINRQIVEIALKNPTPRVMEVASNNSIFMKNRPKYVQTLILGSKKIRFLENLSRKNLSNKEIDKFNKGFIEIWWSSQVTSDSNIFFNPYFWNHLKIWFLDLFSPSFKRSNEANGMRLFQLSNNLQKQKLCLLFLKLEPLPTTQDKSFQLINQILSHTLWQNIQPALKILYHSTGFYEKNYVNKGMPAIILQIICEWKKFFKLNNIIPIRRQIDSFNLQVVNQIKCQFIRKYKWLDLVSLLQNQIQSSINCEEMINTTSQLPLKLYSMIGLDTAENYLEYPSEKITKTVDIYDKISMSTAAQATFPLTFSDKELQMVDLTEKEHSQKSNHRDSMRISSQNAGSQIKNLIDDKKQRTLNCLRPQFSSLNRMTQCSSEAKTTKLFSSLKVLEPLESEDIIPEQIRVSDLTLETLFFVSQIGSGQFGNVYLVTDSLKQNLYALKCVNKSLIEQRRVEVSLQSQKKVMQRIDFTFIAKFHKSLKDQKNIYFLLEYINGIEMFDAIRDIGILNSVQCRFYISSIILGLEYLHLNSIIYRDLKPENIMVDIDGYAKLIDMGASKISEKRLSYTIIGTPSYMAPQILEGKGYTNQVDLWSLGICMFEFLCGYLPFCENSDDPYQIYRQITLNFEPKFPKDFTDPVAKSLICQLLSKEPSKRCPGSLSNLKNHQWFSSFDWEGLSLKISESPYRIPQAKRRKVTKQLLNNENLKSVSCFMNEKSKKKKAILTRASRNKHVLKDWDSIF